VNLAAPCLEAVLVPAAFAGIAVAARAVSLSGAAAGFALAVAVYTGAGRGGFAALATFVVLGSAATRVGYQPKAHRGIAQADRGRRSAVHALANCSVAVCAATAMPFVGRPEWLVYALIGSLSTALCDTLGTEVGQTVAGRTWTLLPFRPAAPGTPGAVSFWGTVAGVAGAALVALAAAASGVGRVSLVWVPAAAATVASVAESMVKSRARGGLSGHWFNVANTVVGAALSAAIAAFAG